MTLFSRIFMGLGAFLIVMGIVYGLVGSEHEGPVEMLVVAGGALLIGTYLVRAVQRARASVAAQAAGAVPSAADTEPHVPPTIWPLVFALSTIGIVLGSVGPRWVLAVALVSAVVFGVLLAIGYADLPFSVGQGIFESLFYMIIGLELAHVVGGAVLLGVVLTRTWTGELALRRDPIQATAIYWYFVVVLGIVIYLVLYLSGA